MKAASLLAVSAITFQIDGSHLRLGMAGPPVMPPPPKGSLWEARGELAAKGLVAAGTCRGFCITPQVLPAAQLLNRTATKMETPETANRRQTTVEEDLGRK